jgi:hypothetical protein
MARQQWMPTEGMIVDVASAHGHHESRYTLEARAMDGDLIRHEVKHKQFPPYTVGSRIKLEVSDDRELRFDPNYPGDAAIITTMDMTDQIREASAYFGSAGARSAFDQPAKLPPFGAVGTFRDSPAQLGASGTTAHVLRPDGQPADRPELRQLIHDATSDDPAVRQAARDRLHEIRAQRPGGQVFDQQPAGHDQSPAAIASDAAGVAQRLATLQELLNTGSLTQSEYESRRQQIISEI